MLKQYFYIALVVGICLESVGSDESTENEEEENITDHSFVALIDIVYTDGSKRSCTGAIIDDNVVVTAAHCFVVKSEPEVQPELTASFVVIGTKKMFDTGYEQYLPIERVLTHPKFKGWSADISLVYTFATMTADKPGTVIALAGDKVANVEKNVTVFSWGKYGDDKAYSTKPVSTKQNKHQDSCEDTSGYIMDEPSKEYQVSSYPKHKNGGYKKEQPYNKPTVPDSSEIRMRHNVKRSKTTKTTKRFKQRIGKKPAKILSRYLTSDDELKTKAPEDYGEEVRIFRTRDKQKESLPIARESLDSYLDSAWNKFISTQTVTETTAQDEVETTDTSFKSHYKNWRRQMPNQENSLVVEIFGFITNQVCKKLIEKVMSSAYDDIAQQKDFVCYVSEEYPVTDRDSGAPAVLHGQLIAVTLGGLQCDEDHIGFGMKIVCYCSWIAENVPNGRNMTCCKNCCGKNEKKVDVGTENPRSNKYLLR